MKSICRALDNICLVVTISRMNQEVQMELGLKAKTFSLQIWKAPHLKTSGYVPKKNLDFCEEEEEKKRRRDGERSVYSIRY